MTFLMKSPVVDHPHADWFADDRPAILDDQPSDVGLALRRAVSPVNEAPSAAAPAPHGASEIDSQQAPQPDRRKASRFPSSSPGSFHLLRGGMREEVMVKAGESALRMLLGLVATSFVVRRLGVDAFGSFSYVWSIYAIATPLASLGIDQVVLRAICSDPDRSHLHIADALRVRRFGALGAAAALLLFLAVSRATSQELIVGLIAAAGLAFLISEISMAGLQAELGSRFVARLRLISFAIANVSKIAVALIHPTPVTIALATVAEPAILLLLTRRRSGRATRLGSSHLRPFGTPVAPGHSLLRQGFPYLLSAASVSLYMRCDVVLLHRWSSPSETGLYAAVTRISEVMYFLPVAVGAAATPGLLRLFQVDPRECLVRLRKLTLMLCGIAIAFAASTAVLAPTLLKVAFGREYGAGALVLRVHALSTIPVFAGVAREIWLLARNQGKVSLATTLSGAAINIGLNIILIPRMGALGAAISTTASYTFAVFVAPLVFVCGREFFGFSRQRDEFAQ